MTETRTGTRRGQGTQTTNNRPRRLSPALFLVLGIAILLGGVALIALQSGRPEVSLRVIGMTYDDARVQLLRAGWSPRQGAAHARVVHADVEERVGN